MFPAFVVSAAPQLPVTRWHKVTSEVITRISQELFYPLEVGSASHHYTIGPEHSHQTGSWDGEMM